MIIDGARERRCLRFMDLGLRVKGGSYFLHTRFCEGVSEHNACSTQETKGWRKKVGEADIFDDLGGEAHNIS